jgi:hypothetical protein
MGRVTSFAFDEGRRSDMEPTDKLQCHSLRSSTSQRLVSVLAEDLSVSEVR